MQVFRGVGELERTGYMPEGSAAERETSKSNDQKNKMQRRIGKFTLLRATAMGPYAADVFEVMRFVPLRVESLDYANVYEYIGLSSLFDEVDDYMVVPEYELMITHDPLKGLLVAAARV